jgi:Ca2+-binding EF-hand superfamily protein
MPSKYGKEFAVPKDFPSVLKSFTREVLRSQPDNIYQFGATYFTELLAQADAAARGESDGPRRLDRAELEQLLAQMFVEADTDGSGALNIVELKQVFKMADLGLSDKMLRQVMLEADYDGNGEITYDEFLPVAIDLVYDMYAKMDAEAERAADEEDAREEAAALLVHGMSKEQVEAIMSDIFQKNDVDNSGALSVSEFVKCMQDADIGLTKKEITALMYSCDADGDGTISYTEFVPLCFELLIEIFSQEILKDRRPPSELESFLLECFTNADAAGTGRLGAHALYATIRNADLGLNKLQIHRCLADVAFDEDGTADYAKVAASSADLIYRLLDPVAQEERYEALVALEGGDGMTVHGLDEAGVFEALRGAFAQYDPEGTGRTPQAETLAAIKAALPLTEQEVNALLSCCEFDEAGMCAYDELCSYAFYILQYLAQETAIAA